MGESSQAIFDGDALSVVKLAKMRVIKYLTFLILLSLIAPELAHSDDTKVILSEAVSFYKAQNYKLALAKLESLGENESPKVYYLKGYSYLKLSDYEGAILALRGVLKDKDYALGDYAQFEIGEIYYASKKFEWAISEYKNLLTNYPDSLLCDTSRIRIGQCLLELGSLEAATDTFKAFIRDFPKSIDLDSARFYLGRALELEGRDIEAGRAYHEVVLYHPLSPYSKEAAKNLASLRKRYKIPQSDVSAEALFDRAMIFLSREDYKSARGELLKLVRLYPYSSITGDALLKLGQCEVKRHFFNSAISHFKEAIKRGGERAPEAQYYLAFAYGRSGALRKALNTLKELIKKYPNSDLLPAAQYYIGYYYDVNGYKDYATVAFETFIQKYGKSDLIDDTLFRLGKIYYFKGEWKKAHDTFKLAKDFPPHNFTPACIFWQGRSAERLGLREDAISAYYYLTERFDHTYYSYRAIEKLLFLGIGIKKEEVAEEGIFEITEEETEPQNENIFASHLRKYRELWDLSFYDDALREGNFLVSIAPDDKKDYAQLLLNFANLYTGRYRESIVYAEDRVNEAVMDGSQRNLPMEFWQLAYPKAFFKSVLESSSKFNLDPYLVLAVIREESRFNPRVVSWARAHGLMQIIPRTGYGIARLIGVRPYHTMRLFEPEINIRMGVYYLASLLKRFQGNTYLALAAYNSGPVAVKRWLIRLNITLKNIDIDEFVESIPLQETRGYVQRVFKSYNEYKRIYGGSGS